MGDFGYKHIRVYNTRVQFIYVKKSFSTLVYIKNKYRNRKIKALKY